MKKVYIIIFLVAFLAGCVGMRPMPPEQSSKTTQQDIPRPLVRVTPFENEHGRFVAIPWPDFVALGDYIKALEKASEKR